MPTYKKNGGEYISEWMYYGKKNGWLLKLILDKRNILIVNPQSGYFGATFTFGQNALKELINIDIDDAIKDELLKTEKYAEGKVIQLNIKSVADTKSALKMINIKINN